MKQTVFKKIFRLSLQNLLILGGIFLFAFFVYAANQGKWGYRSIHGGTTVATYTGLTSFNSNQVEEHGMCFTVNNTCSNDVFIPTKTTGEILSFSGNHPVCTILGECYDPCKLPRSGSIDHGQSITAYQDSSVSCGGSCTSETRTCTDGVLGGTYTNSGCVNLGSKQKWDEYTFPFNRYERNKWYHASETSPGIYMENPSGSTCSTYFACALSYHDEIYWASPPGDSYNCRRQRKCEYIAPSGCWGWVQQAPDTPVNAYCDPARLCTL